MTKYTDKDMATSVNGDHVGLTVSTGILLVVLLAAAAIRFLDLGRAAVRADEINFLEQAARGQTVVGLWSKPPWINQIPFADSIALIWQGLHSTPPDERTVREPFAAIGTMTVVGVAVWLARRRSTYAALLAALWLGVLPFHVYHSREAYYYVVVMGTAAGMTLQTASMLSRLRAAESLDAKAYVAWTAWAVLSCLSHMSTWAVTLACWLILVTGVITCIPPPRRRWQIVGLMASAGVISVFMERWVQRAMSAVQEAKESTGNFFGSAFSWVAPRVIPFFTAGANVYGIVATLVLLGLGAHVLRRSLRKPPEERDSLYESLTVIVGVCVAVVYAYVGLVGGGVAKLTYFSVLLPVFLAWAACTLDAAVAEAPAAVCRILRVALPCLVAMVLAKPAWMITQLDGKPTPYKKIREWLDDNLDPGSVVVVDRWFEPWNEMARYAPSRVFVTFTVPDEPYETYRQLRWRDVTREAFEQGRAQGFIRLTRNQEERDGPWTWPETHFARHGKVVNDVGVWLRDSGFAPAEEFYTPNQIRVVTEFFYDRREDVVARKREAGQPFAVFFDQSMRYLKTGPLGILPIQTEQFMDWRLLEQSGTLEVHNLSDSPKSARLRITAVCPRGTKQVVGPDDGRFEFPQGQLAEWMLGPFELKPGRNSIAIKDPRWPAETNPLLVADVQVVPAPEESP